MSAKHQTIVRPELLCQWLLGNNVLNGTTLLTVTDLTKSQQINFRKNADGHVVMILQHVV